MSVLNESNDTTTNAIDCTVSSRVLHILIETSSTILDQDHRKLVRIRKFANNQVHESQRRCSRKYSFPTLFCRFMTIQVLFRWPMMTWTKIQYKAVVKYRMDVKWRQTIKKVLSQKNFHLLPA